MHSICAPRNATLCGPPIRRTCRRVGRRRRSSSHRSSSRRSAKILSGAQIAPNAASQSSSDWAHSCDHFGLGRTCARVRRIRVSAHRCAHSLASSPARSLLAPSPSLAGRAKKPARARARARIELRRSGPIVAERCPLRAPMVARAVGVVRAIAMRVTRVRCVALRCRSCPPANRPAPERSFAAIWCALGRARNLRAKFKIIPPPSQIDDRWARPALLICTTRPKCINELARNATKRNALRRSETQSQLKRT